MDSIPSRTPCRVEAAQTSEPTPGTVHCNETRPRLMQILTLDTKVWGPKDGFIDAQVEFHKYDDGSFNFRVKRKDSQKLLRAQSIPLDTDGRIALIEFLMMEEDWNGQD